MHGVFSCTSASLARAFSPTRSSAGISDMIFSELGWTPARLESARTWMLQALAKK